MITRRTVLKGTAAAGLLAGASRLAMPALAQGKPIKLGYVSPQTGPLAGFAEADKFIIDSFLAATKAKGLKFEVIVKDSQSNPTARRGTKERSHQIRSILSMVASTPETTPCVHDLRGRKRCVAFPRSRHGSPVHRPAGQSRRAGKWKRSIRLTISFGGRGRHRGLHQYVGPARNQ